MMSPQRVRVSVIMACHNSSAFLDEAIGSVLGQTVADLELILIDDCSTDNTLEIASRHRAQDSRVSIISLSVNSGPAIARNAGIRAARGEWLGILDSDDVAVPSRFEEQLRLADSDKDLVMIGSSVVLIDRRGNVMEAHRYPTDHRELSRRLYSYRGYTAHSSMIYRAHVRGQPTMFNQRYERAEDYDLWLRLSENGRIASIDKPLVKLRKHERNISNAEAEWWSFGYAAAICHFLRVKGSADPSSSTVEGTWREFVKWVAFRMEQEKVFEKYSTWASARSEYLTGKRKLTRAVKLGVRLLRSGHAGALAWERLFGSSLPRRLAQEWMKRPTT